MEEDEEDSSEEEEEGVVAVGKLSFVTNFLGGVISGFLRNLGSFRGAVMLNVPSQSFPAASSQQRVAPAGQTGRNKVALKPGRSLMDWVRFSKSGKDLTGLRGRLIQVTEEELKTHNTKEDCWTCIRGMVYNVSPYMEYHPGGEEELMKAAGMDGTDLFDQVHRWVNYESMLKECLVGRMAVKVVTKASRKDTSVAQLNGLAPPPPPTSMAPPAGLAPPPPPPSISLQPSSSTAPPQLKDARPRYDWFQTDVTVNLVVYAKRKLPSSGCTIVDLHGGVLRLEVLLGKMSYMLHLRLAQEAEGSVAVQTAFAVGKIQIVIRKKHRGKWAELGESLDSHGSFLRTKDRALFYRDCTLVAKTEVTHDTLVFRLALPRGAVLHVPVGKHVYLKAHIQDREVVKPYTPVEQSLVPATLQSSTTTTLQSSTTTLQSSITTQGSTTTTQASTTSTQASTTAPQASTTAPQASTTAPQASTTAPQASTTSTQASTHAPESSPTTQLMPAAPPASTTTLQNSTISQETTDLFLMVKIYPDGAFTPYLNNLNIGDQLSVSGPDGPFSLRPLREVTHLYLLAAGTGFTPMARLIRLALEELGALRKTKLMFFNRRERDILWRSELDGLAATEERFQVEYVLSEPCDRWTGRRGRVEASMLTDFLDRPEGSKGYVCVCGPSPFTELTTSLVSQLGFSEEEIHGFQG